MKYARKHRRKQKAYSNANRNNRHNAHDGSVSIMISISAGGRGERNQQHHGNLICCHRAYHIAQQYHCSLPASLRAAATRRNHLIMPTPTATTICLTAAFAAAAALSRSSRLLASYALA